MVGAFPPPMHGMAAINLAVLNQLKAAGGSPHVINISASSLDRSLISRLKRMPRALTGVFRLIELPVPRGSTLYMSLSGSWGQVYELAFLIVARLRNMRIYLHHHNYTYLDHPKILTRMLSCLGSSSACHIVLSHGMAARIQTAYPCVKKVAVVSNATFLFNESSGANYAHEPLRSLGFLSNISEDKGIFDFLDLCEALHANGFPLSAKLAGPFQDDKIESAVRRRLSDLPMIEYQGPVYGADKEEFFRSIDLLIFPTRYPNEAEPLVIHEAMEHGIPVIAYGRGAIPELVDDEVGVVVEPNDAFLPAAMDQIKIWLDDPQSFARCSRASLVRFEKLMHENIERWQALRDEMLIGLHDAMNSQAQN